MKSRYPFYIIAAMAALWMALPLFAQDAAATSEAESESNPVLEMLALIPNTPETQAGVPVVSYIDYRALEAAWPETPLYQSWNEWNAAREADEFGARLWMTSHMRMQAGPSFWEYFNLGDATPELVGFDYLDIDRAVAIGTPPTQGVILAGDFDADAVTTAFTARDYEAVDRDDVTILQAGDPQKMDLANRNNANPFGGALGRSELVAIVPGHLLNSPSEATFQSLVDTYTGKQSPLSADPTYAAAGRAITQWDGMLVQALFLNPFSVGFAPGDPATLPIGASPEQIAKILENPALNGEDYGPLAPYTLAIMADRQEGDEQVILVALVYRDPASAESAAAELTSRLATFSNALVTSSDVPLIEETEGASMSEPRVYADEANGKYVAIAEIRYPMPEPILYNSEGEPAAEGEEGRLTAPGILFRRLIGAIYQRAFYPLAITQ